ncbi:MAG: tetratricopeptide repeat protein [Gemmatimonadales bacterium]
MAYTSEIEKLERRNAENPQGRLFAPLADAYRKQGEVYRAIGVLREGLERHPEYIGAFIVLGRCHLDLSQDAEAGSAFARVLDLDQENVIALKVLAEIAERAGNHSEAVARLEYLLQIDRGNEEAQAQLDRLRTAPAEAAAAPVAPAAAAVAEEPPAPVELAADPVDVAPQLEVASAEPHQEEEVEPAPLEGLQPVSSFASGPVPSIDVPEIVLAADLVGAPPLLVEEPPPLPVDIAPIEGLESVEPIALGNAEAAPAAAAPVDDFGLEREQDIALEGSAENEFQVRSDAERLGEGFVPTAGVNPWQDIAAEAIAMPPSPVESPSSFAGKWAGDGPATDAGDSAPSGDATAPAEPEPAAPEPEPAAHTAAAPDLVVFEADEGVVDAPVAGGEPDLVVTETMAAVYERQGLRAEALLVYRELSSRRPDDTRLRDKVAELEAAAATSGGSYSSPRDSQPPAPRRGYSTSETGGRTVGSFLRGILGARLEAEVRPAPAPAPASRPELEEVGLEAAPTRPAADPVSLSAVFGDDLPPAIPAASHAAAGGTGTGFSFDAFFGSQGSAPREAAGARPAAEDDLEQFHAWLQGLKK